MPLSLVNHGDPAPSGEDLEYERVFTDLLLVAQPKEERQIGDTVVPGAEPDAKKIVEQAEAVLTRSHDLRAAVLFGYGATRLRGLAGLAEATGYIRGCLEQYWDTCHPELDADDDNDPTMRINAVLTLADADTILRGLRLAPLSESRAFGRLGLRDIAVAEGEMTPPPDMDQVPDSAAVAAAFQDSDADVLAERLAAARAALADVEAMDAAFAERTPGQGPELDPADPAAEGGGAAAGRGHRRQRRRRCRGGGGRRRAGRRGPVRGGAGGARRPRRHRRARGRAQRHRPDRGLLRTCRAIEPGACAAGPCAAVGRREFHDHRADMAPGWCRKRQPDWRNRGRGPTLNRAAGGKAVRRAR